MAAFAAVITLTGCNPRHLPTHEQSRLKAISVEAGRLVRAHPDLGPDRAIDVPRSQWPTTTAFTKGDFAAAITDLAA